MYDDKKSINGWTIGQGDYLRPKDDFVIKYEKTLKRRKIISRTAIIFVVSAAAAAFMMIIKIASSY